jgi:hypothetical protein
MIYWTGVSGFDDGLDLPIDSPVDRRRMMARRRARLIRWSLLLWFAQVVVLFAFFAFR